MENVIGVSLFKDIRQFLKEENKKNIFLITDENVSEYYLEEVLYYLSPFKTRVYILESGEKSKCLKVVENIYMELIKYNYDRSTTIISFGGGVVGDISGFVAATYLRGVEYIQIPTTLLAQVDSSIGGKVGIDFGKYKNMIGSFYFPIKTFIDINFLKTLDRREMTSGLGEVLKYGIIKDYDFFRYVKGNIQSIYDFDEEILTEVVEKCVSIKTQVVAMDEKDKGIRKILNFGHTIGHGIESLYDFNRYKHGEAIILGMMYESFISKEMGLIDEEYFCEIIQTLKSLVVPVHFSNENMTKILSKMSHDKKNLNERIVFVLPTGKNKVDIFDNVSKETIRKSLKGDWLC